MLAAILLAAAPAEGQARSGAAPASPPAYATVAGDDWRGYRTREDLRATGMFWWFRREDVMEDVSLVADPLFGQVARITFRRADEPGFAPRITRRLPAPLERMWFRWRMRFSPGWTTAGPNPPGYASSYKVAFWLWEDYEGRGEVQLSNTDQYLPFWMVRVPRGAWLEHRKTTLGGDGTLGRAATDWRDGEWQEFVAFYEKTGPTSARQHWWRRRLTSGGRVAPGPWTYAGLEVSGAPTPRVRAVELGANKNRSTPAAQHIDWGPWEVVDGYRYANPFGMPLRR